MFGVCCVCVSLLMCQCMFSVWKHLHASEWEKVGAYRMCVCVFVCARAFSTTSWNIIPEIQLVCKTSNQPALSLSLSLVSDRTKHYWVLEFSATHTGVPYQADHARSGWEFREEKLSLEHQKALDWDSDKTKRGKAMTDMAPEFCCCCRWLIV